MSSIFGIDPDMDLNLKKSKQSWGHVFQKISVDLVEDGLRVLQVQSSWPLKDKRLASSLLTILHFAPTEADKPDYLSDIARRSQSAW
ncbi:hypothetical protein [Methylobacter sp. S3L5C]|uniref:hypothetical protein n=1 Tax=Methylobacter sp. S3L5C TaxID=2839024 RepID=UPI001FABC8AB|nr:hypothetical protein [Methylobacter sp. S3L5C]UOA10207.1 hypothetical protein KKZ03_08225 [Methylobacter sp. S3L5C]